MKKRPILDQRGACRARDNRPERLLALLRPCPAAWIEAYPVERRVNDVRCDDPQLIEAERDLFAPGSGEAT